MQKYGVLILGGGLAGLSAAYHLENAGFRDYLLLEREDEVGGICKSKLIGGYTFDYGPHIFYTRNDYVFNLIKGFLGENLMRRERRAYIFLNGDYIKYPFEANLHDISDKRIVRECLLGAIRRRGDNDPSNFEDWIISTFGEGIAKYYMIPYNRKVWKYDLREMSIDWIKGRVPAPSIEDMIDGALGICEKEFGGNAIFYYPKFGGIG
ncbi:MAG: protoporphyrinogen/coproporphyrinogen oxidase, partial [Candidatus Asgardarchaeia archaeon]